MSRARAAALILGLGLALAQNAQAAEPGLAVQAATGRSTAAPGNRVALLIVPQAAASGSRAALAHADEEAYRKRLSAIGFEVWTLGPNERPQMERSLREAAARLPEDAQIAVFALGPALAAEDDVFLLPQGSPGDLGQRTGLIESEGLRLGDLLRRIASRRPRDLVAIVDECIPAAGARCDLDRAAGTSGASLVGAERAARRGGGGTPLAGRASLREPVLGAMTREGDTFLQFFGAVKEGLADSDLEPRSGSTLTTAFAFLPRNFFAGMRTDCNRIDPNADPASLRTASLEGPNRACDTMAAAYPYARHFEDRLHAGREQRAYQKAVASCSDTQSTVAYGSAYPAGRFRSMVDSFSLECAHMREREDRRPPTQEVPPPPAPAPAPAPNPRITARSAAGWNLSFAGDLLEIKSLANDGYDAQKQSYSTIWQSKLHGDQVMIYVQVSTNERCGDATQYMAEQIRPRRTNIFRSQEINTAPGRSGFVLEGKGTARGQGQFDDRTFLDFVSIRRDDRSTITHIGGRFPPELSGVYRPELIKMMNSMYLPNTDIYTRRCL